MCVMTKTLVGEWLEKKYLEWQTQEGGRKTVGTFSTWLGVERVLLSRWMNGKSSPDKLSADKIAFKLGNEIYDLLGLPRPDPRLQSLTWQWETFSEATKNDLVKRAETNQRSTLESAAQSVAAAKRK